MQRWRRRLVRLVVSLVVLSTVLAGALAWRLATGPIALPWLVPRLEQALRRPDGTLSVRIAGSEIAWDGREREIDLLVRDVRVRAAGQDLLRLPVASLKFAALALLAGRLVLRAVELPGPRLTLQRGADGELLVGLGGGGDVTVSSVAEVLGPLVDPQPGSPFAELRRIEVSGGEVTMAAAGDRPSWRLAAADWVVRREHTELSLTAAGRFEIDRQAVPIRATATYDLPTTTFTATATAGALTPREIVELWPARVHPAVRSWVSTRVLDGRVHDMQVALRGRFPEGAVDVETLDGRFEFEDLAIRPHDGVAPLTGVSGRATFDRTRWRFEVARGQTAGIDVARGTVELPSADSAAAAIGIRATLRGPLERALPLVGQYAGQPALAQATIRGRVDAALAIDVPLGRHFEVQRDLSASGRLRDVAWPALVGGRSLSAGECTFEIARRTLTVRGRAALERVPIDLVLTQPLDRETRHLEVTARLGAAERAALGFDLGPWLEGPALVRATVATEGTAGTAQMSAEVRDAVLSVPALGLEKGAGVAGTAEARLVLADGRVTSIENAVLRYGATRLGGRARLDQTATVQALDLDGTLGPAPGRTSPSQVTLRVAPHGSARTFAASTDDVDLLFRAMGMQADAVGGQLRFDGVVAPGPGLALDGQAEARDFTLTQAPTLARILAATSVPGMANVFGGRGLAVTRLASRIGYRASTITLEDGVVESPSFGMRFAGTVGTGGGALDVRGSLVPSYYGLNTLVGRVPILGTVLTGAKQEGLQVFAFAVGGTTAAPKLTVDPVSSLAPGAVRDLLKLLPRPALPALRR